MRSFAILVLLAATASAQPLKFDGTICRMNRGADRMIIESDAGPRLRVTADQAAVTFEGIRYDLADLRPGSRVRVEGNRNGSQIRATAIDKSLHVPDALADSVFPTHTVTGRFAVREAQTDFFSLHLPGGRYVRVDAKSAYGPHGRVRANALKPGDLLEVSGDWPSNDLLHATSIDVITGREDPTCREHGRLNETKDDTVAREADEESFLQGRD